MDGEMGTCRCGGTALEAHEFKGGGEDGFTEENCGAPVWNDKEGNEPGVLSVERPEKGER